MHSIHHPAGFRQSSKPTLQTGYSIELTLLWTSLYSRIRQFFIVKQWLSYVSYTTLSVINLSLHSAICSSTQNGTSRSLFVNVLIVDHNVPFRTKSTNSCEFGSELWVNWIRISLQIQSWKGCCNTFPWLFLPDEFQSTTWNLPNWILNTPGSRKNKNTNPNI